jgi:putative ABC transport system permease protein
MGTFKLIVTGVVKDYVYGDMYGESAPVIFYDIPQEANLMYVRTKANSDVETTLAKIGVVMKKDNPAYPVTYQFVGDQFNQMF